MSNDKFGGRKVSLYDRLRHWIKYYSLEHEKDPMKYLEKKIWMEIAGIGLGGMASSGAWTSYKSRHYDTLPSEFEKNEVRNIILSMLKSKEYDISDKAIIAYVCADLEITDALPEVGALLQRAKDSAYIKLYRLSEEALTRGIPVRKLVDEKFRRGESV